MTTKRRTSQTSLRSTAIHEAGHVVIGRVLEMPCGQVTILREDDTLGHAVVDNLWEPGDGPRRAFMEAACVTLFAGREAQRVILDIDDEAGDRSDRARAVELITGFPPRGCSMVGDAAWIRYEDKLRVRSNRLVRLHRLPIERVAAALLKHGTLQPADVDAAVNDRRRR